MASGPDRWLAGYAVIETHNHRSVGDNDGIAPTLGRNFESALDGGDGHGSVWKLGRDRCGVDRAGVRHADGDIDEHILCSLAQHPKKSDAGVADRVGNRAPGGLGGIASVNVNAHAHFGNTAHACHQLAALVCDFNLQRRNERCQTNGATWLPPTPTARLA
jgi:hypothetical protein